MTSPAIDPLSVLPPELILRVLNFSPIPSLASLTAVSKSWHSFIDDVHQEAIYSSQTKTKQPPGGARDFLYLSNSTSYSKLFDEIASWKDLCKRQTLLSRNWASPHPVHRDSVLQVGNDAVWRFRADFKRRFIVSTSQAGGFNVTDMDTGCILWQLPSSEDHDGDAVRPYAHLEYQDGMAVFDRAGDAVEVWQADLEGTKRGEFRRIAVLEHDCQTRGFQLSFWTLCVVSNKGKGFVYDMTQRPPKLVTRVQIERDAVGHLDQSSDIVIYSMGSRGYHAYDKATGAPMGMLQPSYCTEKYHLRPLPSSPSTAEAIHQDPSIVGTAKKDDLVPVQIARGPLPTSDPEHAFEGDVEWGAGMLHGDLFVGFSRPGRVFICSDWRKALRDQNSLASHSALLECESDGSMFDLGGWLSVRNHRLLFEIQDRIYAVALDDNNRVQDPDNATRASLSLRTSSIPHLSLPVSFMALYDDVIMTTFTTIGRRQNVAILPGLPPIFPTKAIRIVSLAPRLSNDKDDPASETNTSQLPPGSGLLNLDQSHPLDNAWHSQVGLLQLVRLLGDEFEVPDDIDDDDDDGDNQLAMATDMLDEGSEDWEDEDDAEEQPNEGAGG